MLSKAECFTTWRTARYVLNEQFRLEALLDGLEQKVKASFSTETAVLPRNTIFNGLRLFSGQTWKHVTSVGWGRMHVI